MGHHHKGGGLISRQLQHQVKDQSRGAAVEVAGGFIGQHTGRASDQGAGNRHPLALAAGQLGRAVLHALGQPHRAQGQGRRLQSLRPGLTADQQRHGDVFQRRQFGQQMVKLIDKAQVQIAQAALFSG